MRALSKKNQCYPYSFLLPGTILYLTLFIIPVIFTVYYSFMNWDLMSSNYVGLYNYINVITDSALNIAFKNTFIFTIITSVLKCFLGLLLAILLNRRFALTNFLRTVYFLPAVLSTVSIGIVFSAILHPEVGLVNILLRKAGLELFALNWLGDIKLAIFSVCGIEIWKWTGFTMVIFLAGLQSISNEYYEAASIDGATRMQQFTKITLPMIMPAVNNAVVISLMGGLKVFDIIQVSTGGGPGNATLVFSNIIFKAFGQNLQGEACAAQVVLSILVTVTAMVTYTTIRKREVEV